MLHDKSREGADDQGQRLADKEALDVKPIVVIVANHVLRALDHEMRIMTEPEYIQHDRVPEVHDGPKQEARLEGPEKSRAAVHIAQDQTEDDDKQHGGGQLGRQLVLLRGDLILVLGKRSDPLLDLRRVIVQSLDWLPGHEIDHQGENKTQYDALNCYDHSLVPLSILLSNRNMPPSSSDSSSPVSGCADPDGDCSSCFVRYFILSY